jgi:hypothetical protein
VSFSQEFLSEIRSRNALHFSAREEKGPARAEQILLALESYTTATQLPFKEQPMKKPKFVPTPDALESRIALSGGPSFTRSGAAILTTHALNRTYADIQKAFTNFANHGHGTNYNLLQGNLMKAVSRIPWNRRDGLLAEVKAEAQVVRFNIANSVSKPVMTELQNTLKEVKDFVASEVASGAIVVR